jgi:class 3 adenylate cyclase
MAFAVGPQENPPMAHELACIRVLLLTDVEGSSRLWQNHPAIMGDVLDRLDALVEQSVGSYRGEVIKSRGEGDSHFVVFDQASNAARAAP